jgi:hypothetical protein
MTVSMHRVLVALKAPKTAPELLVLARTIVEAMRGNAWFPAPVPSLATVQAAIDRLEEAEAAALSMAVGLKQARNSARAALVSLLHRLRAYVQGVADENPDSAGSIIEGAALSVAARNDKAKAPLAVLRGGVSGSVRLVAKAVAKVASYEWQQSMDAGKTWVDLPKTLQAKITVSGLTPGMTYGFRFRAITRPGVGDWCEATWHMAQ